MLDDDQLEHHIRELIIDICAVLHSRGYEMVPVGAMMRLVGVGDDRARNHDQEYFALDQGFEELLEQRKKPPLEAAPKGATLH